MADNGDAPRPLSDLFLAGVGWASLGAEAVDELADDLARRVGLEREQMRVAVRDTLGAWRRDVGAVGTRGDEAVEKALAKLGLARRDEVEDLALRVAQLEHRLRLLEREGDTA